MKREKAAVQFVLCIQNDDCEDLELRKVYRVVPDQGVGEEGLIRVIDESGEDYLYPGAFFVPIEIPAAVKRILAAAV